MFLDDINVHLDIFLYFHNISMLFCEVSDDYIFNNICFFNAICLILLWFILAGHFPPGNLSWLLLTESLSTTPVPALENCEILTKSQETISLKRKSRNGEGNCGFKRVTCPISIQTDLKVIQRVKCGSIQVLEVKTLPNTQIKLLAHYWESFFNLSPLFSLLQNISNSSWPQKDLCTQAVCVCVCVFGYFQLIKWNCSLKLMECVRFQINPFSQRFLWQNVLQQMVGSYKLQSFSETFMLWGVDGWW